MRNTITRRLVESKIHGYSIELKNGEPTVQRVEPIVVYGKVSKETATKELKKAYGKDEALTVSKIEETEKQFVITVEDFVAHAKEVPVGTPETDEEK